MPFLEGVKGDEFAFFYSFVRFCRYFRCEYEKNILNLQRNNKRWIMNSRYLRLLYIALALLMVACSTAERCNCG